MRQDRSVYPSAEAGAMFHGLGWIVDGVLFATVDDEDEGKTRAATAESLSAIELASSR